jgi:hypothetical protein
MKMIAPDGPDETTIFFSFDYLEKIFSRITEPEKFMHLMEAFLQSAKSGLVNWTPEVRWGHNSGNHFCMYMFTFLKILKNIFLSRNTEPEIENFLL